MFTYDENPHLASSYARMVLAGLQQKPVLYYGTVDYVTKQERRAKNRIARKQNLRNRRGF